MRIVVNVVYSRQHILLSVFRKCVISATEWSNWFVSPFFFLRVCISIFLFMWRKKLTRFLSTSSGTFLVELHSALAALCEKITGALVVCRAALIVLVETCERSTNMPSLFNSLTTAWRIMKHVKSLPSLIYIKIIICI